MLDGDRVHLLLLRLAKGTDVEFSNEHIKKEAVRALVARDETGVGSEISELLSPKQSIVVRDEVARGLLRVSCPEECIGRILSYLKYIRDGGANIEDDGAQLLLDRGGETEFVQDVLAALRRQQNDLCDTLYSVLANNLPATETILQQDYGHSDDFAPELLAKLRRMPHQKSVR
ncbi:MAG: hypothetical protein GC160_00080 [Acidobacteria bacterium]|nr:hypothetical protein [Acidobacteriota bacterium]